MNGIFLYHCIAFGLQIDCICAPYGKGSLCIFEFGNNGSFVFAGSVLRNTIAMFLEHVKIGATKMNTCLYSEVTASSKGF